MCIFMFGILIFVFGYKSLLKSIYCKKYEDVVNKASMMYNIEPELIYAIIKNESGFDSSARSLAGALGLMQITPDTFRWLQTYTEDVSMGTEKLFDPEVNINYGTLFISILRRKYNSDDLVLCAYNAGISTVERWIKNGNISDFGEELMVIPYKETREYIIKIKKCEEMYRILYFNKL